jgi:rhamnosyl/mannosyltransferase
VKNHVETRSTLNGVNSYGGRCRRLKVLHLGKYYPPHRGGIETHVQVLCKGLSGEVDLEVVVSTRGGLQSDDIEDGFLVRRMWTPLTLSNAPISPGMIGALRDFQPDVVHLHHPNPFAMLAFFLSGSKAKLVITYHSDIVRQKALSQAFAPILACTMRRASAILVSSAQYRDSSPVLRQYRDRCHVVPFGIEEQGFLHPDVAQVEEIRRRHGSRLILAVGRLVYYKGFEYLVEAMRDVHSGKLIIAGDGPLREYLLAKAQAMGAQDRVELIGNVVDLAPYYQAADIFVLPSIARSESFGIVQLEAMACGKPVVNTQIDSGVPYVSLDGVTGLTVNPQSPEALSQAINQLMTDADLRKRLGEAARERVRHEFSQRTMAAGTLQIYQMVTQTVPVKSNHPGKLSSVSTV